MTEPKNILIVRTDRIGDVVLSLPLAAIIKKHFPGCKVTFLLRNYTKDIAKNNPHIDNVLILKEVNGKIPVWENVKQLKNKNFDSSIIVYPTYITALIVFLSRIKIRIGSGYRSYSFLFNKKIFEHRKYAEKHELEFNVNLLKIFGIEESISFENVEFNIRINEGELEAVRNVTYNLGVDPEKKIIIIHPGSGGSAIDLPVEKFSQLVSNLNSLNNINLIVSGSKSEYNICESVVGNSKAINLAGKFKLSEMICLISLCDVFISNSTGPIHIAAALGKKTVGFYPKILACSPTRWGPYTKNKVIFSPEIECNDCTREQCEQLNCMNSINIDKVTKKVVDLLST
jgi:lipopolysaccharide heptosyltransferase II